MDVLFVLLGVLLYLASILFLRVAESVHGPQPPIGGVKS